MFALKSLLTTQLSVNRLNKKKPNGFTLIELVIGIFVLSVALMVMTGALFPQAERSTNPWFQVRSAELAQSMMNEIIARRFDENSAQTGALRCGESGASACTVINACGFVDGTGQENPWIEEGSASRQLFDDVDDFDCFSATGSDISNIDNQSLDDVYAKFTINVSVRYAGTDLGLANTDAKLITVTVTPPLGDDVVYASYKANY